MGVATWIAVAADAAAMEALLFAAIGFAIGGLDDLAVDLLWLWHRATGRLRDRHVGEHGAGRARAMAIFVPAWDESAVIGAMLRSAIRRIDHDDWRIFVGVYPNDPATIEAVATVAAGEPRILLVVHDRAGPTTKADCLNALWRAMLRDERARGRAYHGVVLHDAEDVIHPDELTVLASVLGDRHAAQVPVLPIADPASRLVSGHYLDEFAESHLRTLPLRAAIGASLPLAGVGCAIRRDMIGGIADERGGDPFDAASLTEDYELGLAIAARGGRSAFARVRAADGSLVAVREYFPARFPSAVRQKGRWMVGIALAGWDRTGWGGHGPVEWWMRMRDRRAPLSVIVLLAGYVGLALLSVALVAGALAGIPRAGWPAGLDVLLAVTAFLFLWRLAMRAACTGAVHGRAEAARSIPRYIVANIVAMAAARRALILYAKMLGGRGVRWDKTEHRFPAAEEVA